MRVLYSSLPLPKTICLSFVVCQTFVDLDTQSIKLNKQACNRPACLFTSLSSPPYYTATTTLVIVVSLLDSCFIYFWLLLIA